jgi:hypothetical protein
VSCLLLLIFILFSLPVTLRYKAERQCDFLKEHSYERESPEHVSVTSGFLGDKVRSERERERGNGIVDRVRSEREGMESWIG